MNCDRLDLYCLLVTNRPAATIDLQTAADELGVHYQTAYRWVRSGRLPAELIGGRYTVTRRDVDSLALSRLEPASPPRPGRARLDRASERMHDALVTGDEAAARTVARRLVSEGTSIVDLVQEVFVPPLRRIGAAWHDGELPIWVEHRASEIVERVLGELTPNPRGRRRGTAVVAALSGDRHSLPTVMAAVALREDNWHVQHLGADMPPDELMQFCEEHTVTLAVVTVTNSGVAHLAMTTARRLRTAGTPTIVGGPGLTLDEMLARAREAARSTP